MVNNGLKNKVKNFKAGNKAEFSGIFAEFERLIHFYTNRVGLEDTFQELTLALIEVLADCNPARFASDEALRRYIAVCIRNRYILFSKHCCFSDRSLEDCDPADCDTEKAETQFLEDALERLSDKQRLVVVYKYLYGYSDEEISAFLRITRQAVNRLKIRAMEQLRFYYFDKGEERI